MAYNTIVLKGYPMRNEKVAAGTITPGHLIYITSGNQVAVHAVAAAKAQTAFAIENELYSSTSVFNTIDTNYVVNDNVLYGVFAPGDEVNALVAAAAPAIVIGDYLESAGNGTLRKVATAATAIAIARSAVDNSAGGAPVRVVAEIM